MFFYYYSHLVKSCDKRNFDAMLNFVNCKIDDFENSVLIAPVTGCEVRDCVSAGGFKSS